MIDDFPALFKLEYPEFQNVDDAIINRIYKKVFCLYPVIQGNSCKSEQLSFLVVAHYLVVDGKSGESSLVSGGGSNTNGAINSASIDGVSVSYQAKPISDFYQDFFSTSRYGLEFLALLASFGSATYIN